MISATEARSKTNDARIRMGKEELSRIENDIKRVAERGESYVCCSEVTKEAQNVLVGLDYKVRNFTATDGETYTHIEW